MGLLKHLLFWPVTGPLFLIDFSLNKVNGVVGEQLTDDTEIKSELLELQLKLELGEIDDDEYVRRETEVMQKLREIRQWREAFGMGVSGGAVRVSAPTEEEREAAEAEEKKDAAENTSTSSSTADVMVAKPGEVTIELNFDDWHK